jgi:mannose-6-phosphate isomerase
MTIPFLQLSPAYYERVWGGQHLRPTQPPAIPIGEAWLVHENNTITNSALRGQTLAQCTSTFTHQLLGQKLFQRYGARFPLLIKILDCADWLSVQVHPNDAQAVQLEGAGQFGKTEAWHVLEAKPDAKLIAGIKDDTPPATLAQAIRDGSILDHVAYRAVKKGDTVFMPAGTIHALGPGLLVYEVQQTSDITYRVYDWNRPMTTGRKLHIEQSIAVSDPAATGAHFHAPTLANNDSAVLTSCHYFTLELINAENETVTRHTHHASFHAITLIAGNVNICSGTQIVALGRFETVIVPAHYATYDIVPNSPSRLLVAHV